MPIFSGFVEDVPAAAIYGRLKVPVAHPTATPVTKRVVSRLHHHVNELKLSLVTKITQKHMAVVLPALFVVGDQA